MIRCDCLNNTFQKTCEQGVPAKDIVNHKSEENCRKQGNQSNQSKRNRMSTSHPSREEASLSPSDLRLIQTGVLGRDGREAEDSVFSPPSPCPTALMTRHQVERGDTESRLCRGEGALTESRAQPEDPPSAHWQTSMRQDHRQATSHESLIPPTVHCGRLSSPRILWM